MESNLLEEEEKVTNEFLRIINEIRVQHKASPISMMTALKFVMARKFDLNRSLALYEAHETTRFRERLTNFDPNKEPLKSELESGKFTVLSERDSSGAAIAMFTLCKHIPQVTTHQTTLQGVVYQLDIALEDVATQRSGIVFIYNMSNSKYSNFDYELSQKILDLLKGAYPARLKKVLIIMAPLWFKAPFKILRLFVKEKLRKRLYMINTAQLSQHIAPSSLPVELGGQLEIKHGEWLAQCRATRSQTLGDLNNIASTNRYTLTALSQNGAILGRSMSQSNGSISDDDDSSSTNGPGIGECVVGGDTGSTRNKQNRPKPENIVLPSATLTENNDFLKRDSVHLNNDHGMTLEDFIQYLKCKGRKGLYEEYGDIKDRTDVELFPMVAFKLRANQSKNRYMDVPCKDETRVILSTLNGDASTDYINANFVDGFMQKNAFISTQGPLLGTYEDFWRMVWEQEVVVIVMTTRTFERGRAKCGQYWPLEGDEPLQAGRFILTNTSVEKYADYFISTLTLTNNQTGVSRQVTHMQYISWPDFGVPQSAYAMLDFRDKVRKKQADAVSAMGSSWTGHPLGPPIVVHCSAGIGRTGTFITIDISIKRLEETGLIDVKTTVEKIRTQRSYSIQMPDQYVFCYLALLEFALSRGLLQDVDLTGFDESESEFEE